MTLKIHITMENAAFEPEQGTEAARLLRQLAERIDGLKFEKPGKFCMLLDFNGNCTGYAQITQ